MMRRSTYTTIKEGIDNGTYKQLRLVKINNEGAREVLVSYNGTKDQNLHTRLDYIKFQLDKNLGPGKYLVECKAGFKPSSLEDKYEVIVRSKALIPAATSAAVNKPEEEKIIDLTHEQEIEEETMNLEEYKDLLREVAELRAANEVYELKVKHLEQQLAEAKAAQPLNDEPEKNTLEVIIEQAAPVLDEWLKTRKDEIQLRHRQMDLAEKGIFIGGNKKRVIKKATQPAQRSAEEILADMQQLQATNEEQFEATLDEMEEKDPQLYDYICTQMGLYGEEEEEEQE